MTSLVAAGSALAANGADVGPDGEGAARDDLYAAAAGATGAGVAAAAAGSAPKVGDVHVAVSAARRPDELVLGLTAHGFGSTAHASVTAAARLLAGDQGGGCKTVPSLEGSASGIEVVHGDQVGRSSAGIPGVTVTFPLVSTMTTAELAHEIGVAGVGALAAVEIERGEYGDVGGGVEVEGVGAHEVHGHAVPYVDGVEGELRHVVGYVVALVVRVGGCQELAGAAGAVAVAPSRYRAVGIEGQGAEVDVDFLLRDERDRGVRPVVAERVGPECAVEVGVAGGESADGGCNVNLLGGGLAVGEAVHREVSVLGSVERLDAGHAGRRCLVLGVETGTAAPLAVRHGEQVGFSRSQSNIARGEVGVAPQFLGTGATGGGEDAVLVTVDPHGHAVILVGHLEFVVAGVGSVEVGQPEVHVFVVPGNPYAGVLEVVVAVETESVGGGVVRLALRHGGTQRLKGPQGLYVVLEITVPSAGRDECSVRVVTIVAVAEETVCGGHRVIVAHVDGVFPQGGICAAVDGSPVKGDVHPGGRITEVGGIALVVVRAGKTAGQAPLVGQVAFDLFAIRGSEGAVVD